MPNPAGPVIWVVEDDPSAQRIIVENLKTHGFRHAAFSSAEKAYASLYDREKPAMIILDMLLPGMSGVDLIRLLKQNDDWACIPVVVVSVLTRQDAPASDHPELINTAYWMNKPFEPTDLIKKVQEILLAVRA
jgi:DNA-binding response OmpR family regulator